MRAAQQRLITSGTREIRLELMGDQNFRHLCAEPKHEPPTP